MIIAMYLIFTLPFVAIFILAIAVLRRRSRKTAEVIDFYDCSSQYDKI